LYKTRGTIALGQSHELVILSHQLKGEIKRILMSGLYLDHHKKLTNGFLK